MIQCAQRLAVLLLFVAIARPCLGEQLYLYTPKAVEPEEKGASRDGVLVQDVPVQKGDTLFRLSRKFSGHGMYYPQILLFNNIKDPNLIHTGDTLKVPLGQGSAADEVSAPVAVKSRSAHNKHKRGGKKERRHTRAVSRNSAPEKVTSEQSTDLSAQDLKRIEHAPVTPRKERVAPSARHGNAGQSAVNTGTPAVATNNPPAATNAATKAPSPSTDSAAEQKLFERAVKAYRQDDYRTALELFDRYLTENPGSALAADASLYKAECYLKLSTQ